MKKKWEIENVSEEGWIWETMKKSESRRKRGNIRIKNNTILKPNENLSISALLITICFT